MLVNDITPERLRELATIRPGDVKVLSVFVNLDPREFATQPARASEVHSVLDRAARRVRAERELTHAERISLDADLEHLRVALDDGSLDARGAHALAVFCASGAGLFEILKLARPVEQEPVVAPTPFVEPLMLIGAPEQWCVLLANRRMARVFCGTRDRLDELDLVKDFVPGRHDQGGFSQSNYQHHIDKRAEDHLKHTAEVVFDRLRDALPAGLLIGAPHEMAGELEARLHPYLRERLVGRFDIDVENATPEQVRQAVAPQIDAAAERQVDEAVRRLTEAFGIGDRAAGGLADVLRALLEQRVESLLVDRGFRASGVACPTCGWLSATPADACPIDGAAVEAREDVVEAAVERALTQSAQVLVLRDRPELASHGHIAATLRF